MPPDTSQAKDLASNPNDLFAQRNFQPDNRIKRDIFRTLEDHVYARFANTRLFGKQSLSPALLFE
jgi:hypothetical protein